MYNLVFTVTNNLTYDQRMQRICTSLAHAGYNVTLVGRHVPASPPLNALAFKQRRLHAVFAKGKLMYLAFNARLFFYLLFVKADVICAIDLDTILPVYLAGKLRRKLLVYDAHELFTEQKEIVTRPRIHKMWLAIERFAVPRFANGYTVNNFIKGELNKRYSVQYAIVRNLPVLKSISPAPGAEKFIIYQGAVNEGRSFETLIPAMKMVAAKLVICGEGNFFEQVQQLIKRHGVEDKVEARGYVAPSLLSTITPQAHCAVMLFENTGLNQYYSLANRFFDYMMAGIPQVCVAYPEYKAINDVYGFALLIPDTKTETIAAALNKLLTDETLYHQLQTNCMKARQVLNWQNEEKTLLAFYEKLCNKTPL